MTRNLYAGLLLIQMLKNKGVLLRVKTIQVSLFRQPLCGMTNDPPTPSENLALIVGRSFWTRISHKMVNLPMTDNKILTRVIPMFDTAINYKNMMKKLYFFN